MFLTHPRPTFLGNIRLWLYCLWFLALFLYMKNSAQSWRSSLLLCWHGWSHFRSFSLLCSCRTLSCFGTVRLDCSSKETTWAIWPRLSKSVQALPGLHDKLLGGSSFLWIDHFKFSFFVSRLIFFEFSAFFFKTCNSWTHITQWISLKSTRARPTATTVGDLACRVSGHTHLLEQRGKF